MAKFSAYAVGPGLTSSAIFVVAQDGETYQYGVVEAIQDVVGAYVVGSSLVAASYDDSPNQLVISLDEAALTEFIQDVGGQFIVGSGAVTVTYGDSPNQLVISLGALAHSDVTDWTEAVQDTVGQFTVGSAYVDVTYGDSPDQMVVSLNEAALTEFIQDVAGQVLVGGTGVTITYGDSPNQIVVAVDSSAVKPTESLAIACSDETTALTAGTAKVTLRMPYAFTLSEVRASLSTAQTSGGQVIVDINEGGSTILSTKIIIDNGSKTSVGSSPQPVISDTSLADNAEITIDIDNIGDGTAKGLKVYLIGSRT